jgi:RHS repeat-associated protein
MGKTAFFSGGRLEKKGDALKNRYNYYPFGLTFNSYTRSYSKANNYKYQGKEEVPEMGVGTYDFHARMYDATLGRTFQIDPLADNFLDVSPYSWVMNNPLINIDPTGMSSTTLYGEDAQEAFGILQNIYGGGSSAKESAKSDKSCPDCPDGQGQEQGDNLMPEGSLSYKDVTPLGEETVSSREHRYYSRSNTGSDLGDGLSVGLTTTGVYAGSREMALAREGMWQGKNGKWYSTKWGGNGATGARSSVLARANKFSALGRYTFVGGAIISGVQFMGNPTLNQGLQSGTDIGMGYISTLGPVGFTISTIYFGDQLLRSVSPSYNKFQNTQGKLNKKYGSYNVDSSGIYWR